ncbi:MAG: MltA domain-containing protein [Paludibacterium sp.]|uniref:murein transglycosylase A n=1 Tax=Paludibacterium sp. TaxID=1917523 RepID=UPI0025F04349|nr:MltA domain-containing protein [Paludibacterium sp.]MBV8047418.1 MltA domain-containing protein [Paludibacterium sp.]MBV8646043.1 MltA domain-containing protein [Paludibacterium sp.]
MLSRSLGFLFPLALLTACSSMPPAPVSSGAVSHSYPVPTAQGAISFSPEPVSALPDWQRQDLTGSLRALRQSCRVVAREPQWSAPCQGVTSLTDADNAGIHQFFESRFTAWRMHDGARDSGLITGYYEPILNGSRSQSAATPYPVYGVPSDLVSLTLPASARNAGALVARRVTANRLALVPGAAVAAPGQVAVNPADFPPEARAQLKGRIEDGRLVPYYTRAQIAAGMGVDHAPVLAWVEDSVELFFLQIQGAGRIQLDDGSILRVGVADNNGYGYQSIGRWLADQGEMSLGAASMSGIQNWVRMHPERQQALFNVNPRYIFFRTMPDSGEGPVGALGVPLTDGYSIAVDPHYIPLGTPVYLATTQPHSQSPLNRLVHAQDTGSAIRGALRADFFWGYGAEAGLNAGGMKQAGSMWLLLPNGTTPSL